MDEFVKRTYKIRKDLVERLDKLKEHQRGLESWKYINLGLEMILEQEEKQILEQ